MIKKISIFVLLVLLVPIAYSAIDADIEVKSVFEQGDNMYFNYSLMSDSDVRAVIFPHIECSGNPIAPMLEKEIFLKKGELYEDVYLDTVIDDAFEPGECRAYIRFVDPVHEIESENFSIDVIPDFSFRIELDKKVFLLDEEIDIDYETDVENPMVSAVLTLPDKSKKELELPVEVRAEQTGTYGLEVTALKEGYKAVNVKEEFAVIKEHAEIEFTGVCDGDSACEEGENIQNCPQDCTAEAKPKRIFVKILSGGFLLLLAGLTVTLIAVAVYFGIRKLKGK
ncbi:hypothetical protein GF361_04400 [Candidatus Woesearchaeota archaeon]|nr:hypothetical protein [Candidatus Woesearchaeota archaeon]